MRSAACPRFFEAEAMRDGRLTGAERASFERHAKLCAACSREIRALEALGDALRVPPQGEADELHVLRERTRLLAAFDRVLVAPEARTLRAILWLAAAAVLVAAFVVVRVRPGARATHPSPVAVVRAAPSAAWSERTDADAERIVLERGALWIQVDHRRGAGRLVVVLPDGELEDMGTTFSVDAENGRTTRVAVLEGQVVLRLRDRPPVTIETGGSWAADAPDASPAAVPSVATALPPDPPPAVSPQVPTQGRGAPPPGSSSGSPASPDAAAALFRASTAALDTGDACHAGSTFARFLEKYPSDGRAEDAAYLRILAYQRCGETGAMKEAAQDYLRRYAAGFRRTEVEALLR
jgi:hypothetical protein